MVQGQPNDQGMEELKVRGQDGKEEGGKGGWEGEEGKRMEEGCTNGHGAGHWNARTIAPCGLRGISSKATEN